MSTAAVKPSAYRLHPLPLRIMHWINAAAIFIMIGSGWRIYNDDVLFGWLHFPDFLVIGKWAQYGLQWHFFGMWIFALNGLAYLTYGIFTGRLPAETVAHITKGGRGHRRRRAALAPIA
jgi:thiosulfate reductase cytochrome b subunit